MSWIEEAKLRRRQSSEAESLRLAREAADAVHFESELPITKKQVVDFLERFRPVVTPILEELKSAGYKVSGKKAEFISQGYKYDDAFRTKYPMQKEGQDNFGTGYYDHAKTYNLLGIPWKIEGVGQISALPKVNSRTHFSNVDFVIGDYKNVVTSLNPEDLKDPEKLIKAQESLRQAIAAKIAG